jgi:hypothetical protein
MESQNNSGVQGTCAGNEPKKLMDSKQAMPFFLVDETLASFHNRFFPPNDKENYFFNDIFRVYGCSTDIPAIYDYGDFEDFAARIIKRRGEISEMVKKGRPVTLRAPKGDYVSIETVPYKLFVYQFFDDKVLDSFDLKGKSERPYPQGFDSESCSRETDSIDEVLSQLLTNIVSTVSQNGDHLLMILLDPKNLLHSSKLYRVGIDLGYFLRNIRKSSPKAR